MEKEKFSFGTLIEKYRFIIGGGLLVLILIGSGILLHWENYSGQNYDTRIGSLEEKVEKLESQKSEALDPKSETNQNSQNSNDQTGQVAGATAQATDDNSKQITAGQKVTGKINLNTATAAQLDTLPGIGATYAGRIIEYRTSHGGFKSIEEIKNVKGIGDKTFEKFKDLISI